MALPSVAMAQIGVRTYVVSVYLGGCVGRYQVRAMVVVLHNNAVRGHKSAEALGKSGKPRPPVYYK